MNIQQDQQKITGKEPLTQAYLDILFNKSSNSFTESELDRKFESNCNEELTKLDTRLEATKHKVDYIKQQAQGEDYEQYQQKKKQDRAVRAADRAEKKLDRGVEVLDINGNIQQGLLVIMSEKKNLEIELKQAKKEIRDKNSIIENLRKELQQYKQREVLYQDEIINFKVEEQLQKEKSQSQHQKYSPQRQYQKNDMYSQNQLQQQQQYSPVSNKSYNVQQNNNNIYSNNYSNINNNNNNKDVDFWGRQEGYEDNQYSNVQNNQQALNDILGSSNRNLWANNPQQQQQDFVVNNNSNRVGSRNQQQQQPGSRGGYQAAVY